MSSSIRPLAFPALCPCFGQDVLAWLRDFNNCFHDGSKPSFIESYRQVILADIAWNDEKAKRNAAEDSDNFISPRDDDYESKHWEWLQNAYPKV